MKKKIKFVLRDLLWDIQDIYFDYIKGLKFTVSRIEPCYQSELHHGDIVHSFKGLETVLFSINPLKIFVSRYYVN